MSLEYLLTLTPETNIIQYVSPISRVWELYIKLIVDVCVDGCCVCVYPNSFRSRTCKKSIALQDHEAFGLEVGNPHSYFSLVSWVLCWLMFFHVGLIWGRRRAHKWKTDTELSTGASRISTLGA